jgi:hypothetical protein
MADFDIRFGWKKFNSRDEKTFPKNKTWVIATNYDFSPVYASRVFFADGKFSNHEYAIKPSEITHWSYIEKVTNEII